MFRALDILHGYAKLAAKEMGLIRANDKAALRFAKCVECPLFNKNFCSVCGCYMPAKVLIDKATCPKGKWA